MRKIVILGLLASMLTIVTAPVLAGGVEDCDTELKFKDVSPGLYGLCIAWHNADSDNARASIERAFAKKATGPNDPDIIPGSEPIGTTCPCLDMLASRNQDDWGKILDWGDSRYGCYDEVIDDFLFTDATFVNADLPEYDYPVRTYFEVKSDGEFSQCKISQFEIGAETGISIATDTTIEEYDVCFQELQARCPITL